MKVLFFAKSTLDKPSTNYRCNFLAEELRQRGLETDVILPLNLSTSSRLLDKPYRLAIFAHRSYRLLKNWDADVLFVQGTPYRIETLPQIWAFKTLLGRPLLYNFDDANYLHRPYITKWLTQLADKVMVPTNRLEEYARCFSDHVARLPLGVNTDFFTPPESPPSNSVLRTIWFGDTSSHETNLEFLRTVFDGIDSTTAHLTLVGRKTEFLKELFPEEDDRFSLTGYLKQEELIHRLQQSDLGLVPIENTLWANSKFPVKSVEMLASGLPVLASRNSAASRIIDESNTGFALPNDPDAWVDKMTSLAGDRKTLKGFRSSARRVAVEEHDIARVADRAVEQFNTLVGES